MLETFQNYSTMEAELNSMLSRITHLLSMGATEGSGEQAILVLANLINQCYVNSYEDQKHHIVQSIYWFGITHPNFIHLLTSVELIQSLASQFYSFYPDDVTIIFALMLSATENETIIQLIIDCGFLDMCDNSLTSCKDEEKRKKVLWGLSNYVVSDAHILTFLSTSLLDKVFYLVENHFLAHEATFVIVNCLTTCSPDTLNHLWHISDRERLCEVLATQLKRAASNDRIIVELLQAC